MPPWIGLHNGCAGRAILPERKAGRSGQFRQCARVVLVQFDTHRTRQIAAGDGGKQRHSRDGSFSVKSDLVSARNVT